MGRLLGRVANYIFGKMSFGSFIRSGLILSTKEYAALKLLDYIPYRLCILPCAKNSILAKYFEVKYDSGVYVI